MGRSVSIRDLFFGDILFNVEHGVYVFRLIRKKQTFYRPPEDMDARIPEPKMKALALLVQLYTRRRQSTLVLFVQTEYCALNFLTL